MTQSQSLGRLDDQNPAPELVDHRNKFNLTQQFMYHLDAILFYLPNLQIRMNLPQQHERGARRAKRVI